MFEVVADHQDLPVRLAGGVIAIGNFDGVHLGHQAVIAAARRLAHEQGKPALVLTFEPHPRSFFKPGMPVFRLTPLPEKLVLFETLQLQGAVIKGFNADLAELSADEFVAMLAETYGAHTIVAGHDFHFGKGREGTPETLQKLSTRYGMDTILVPAESDSQGRPVSSSSIRTMLENGSIADANRLLGYRWFITGTVRHGDKRGRLLGFPTANIALDPSCRLKAGVYAGRVRVDDHWFGAALHYGQRVQFGGGPPLLEAYILDFKGDLYGQALRAEFLDFVRAEQKFETTEALVSQMAKDVDAVRAVITAALRMPVSALQARLEACTADKNV